jgi:hypothetical protein
MHPTVPPRTRAPLVVIDRNRWSPCVGTSGLLRRYAQAVGAAFRRRLLQVPAARGDMIDQSDDLNTLPGGHSRGFTGLILAALVIIGAFMIILYYSP